MGVKLCGKECVVTLISNLQDGDIAEVVSSGNAWFSVGSIATRNGPHLVNIGKPFEYSFVDAFVEGKILPIIYVRILKPGETIEITE